MFDAEVLHDLQQSLLQLAAKSYITTNWQVLPNLNAVKLGCSRPFLCETIASSGSANHFALSIVGRG
jgi:hypothetical protein